MTLQPLTYVYSYQLAKRPQNATARKVQPAIYYKLMSLQLCDLSTGIFLCMLLDDRDTCGIL